MIIEMTLTPILVAIIVSKIYIGSHTNRQTDRHGYIESAVDADSEYMYIQ